MRRLPLRRHARALAAFAREERGSVLAEFVIVVPALVWTMIATFSYWDVYRSLGRVEKATYTVADHLGRFPGAVRKADLDGLQKLMDFLIDADQSPALRFTSVGWDDTKKLYTVDWSCSPSKALPLLTNANINGIKAKLPTLEANQSILLVETQVTYEPPLGIDSVGGTEIGVGQRVFRDYELMPIRSGVRMPFEGPACT